MCGIVAIISKDKKLPLFSNDVFTDMLRMDSIRGEDSTGAFGVTPKGVVDMIKGDIDGYRFVTSEAYSKFRKRINSTYQIIVGHNRKATKNNVSPHNAHPFRDEHIYLVHNGIMRNADAISTEVEVDSMAIAKALAQHHAQEGLKRIDGAYALVWFDQKDQTLSLARNDERPLFLVEYDACWIVSSEGGLPLWLMGREGRKHLSVKLLEPEKLLCFNLQSPDKGYTEIAYEEYTNWTPPKPVEVTYPMVPRNTSSYPANDSGTLLQRKIKNLKLSAGDSVVVKIDNYEAYNGSNVLLGHPVIDDIPDTEVIIRACTPLGLGIDEIIEKATNGTLFTATVQQWRGHQGVPMLFVRNLKPYDVIKDFGNKTINKEELEAVIKLQMCGRCKNALNLADISQSIARKKEDNTWRLLCKNCLNHSIMSAHKPQIDVHLVQ